MICRACRVALVRIPWPALAIALGFGSGRAGAAEPAPLVHPIFAHLPDAPEDGLARQVFAAAAARYKLAPVEVIDVPAPPEPKAPVAARIGILSAQKLAFTEALQDLDAAAGEVAATGGAGLSTDELSDLYLFRAMSTARADWNAAAAAAPTEARTRAFDDYLRAATLTPKRVLNPRQLPPQVVADFQRAVEIVRGRPRGSLVVAGSADARVAVDGGAPIPVAGGLTLRDLVFGEHLVRVEELGFAPWGTAVPFGQASLEIDIPARPPLALDDATAAAHARRMGARFALVAQPRGGVGTTVEVRLIDVATAASRDAALVSATGEAGQVDAAVMRLDEEARRVAMEAETAARGAPGQAPGGGSPTGSTETSPATAASQPTLGPPLLIAPPPAKARFGDDPAAWARDHWPLLTAIGVVALTSIVLGAAVSADR